MPGPSVFPLKEPGVSGNFGGRRKAVRDRFALQGGTGDFPGDAVAGKGQNIELLIDNLTGKKALDQMASLVNSTSV